MKINELDIGVFGADLLMEYQIGGYELETAAFKGRKRSSFVLLNQVYGFKTLTIPLVFVGTSKDDVEMKKSKFEAQAFGKVELRMDDGFLYSAYLSDIGKPSYPNPLMIECDYTFIGIRHGELRTIINNQIFCDSTVPNTDCILTVTVGETGTNYVVDTVTFPNVTQGQILTVDGINKRILVNGAPGADQATWITFPSLTPGLNNIQCDDVCTVEYYPVYF